MSSVESSPGPDRTTAMPGKSWVAAIGLDRFSALYLWAFFMILFGIWRRSTFLTKITFEFIPADKVTVAVLALAFLIPLAADTFDLSVGSSMALALVVVNKFSLDHHSVPQGVVALMALGACAILGFVNGFIVVKLHVNSFIATLGMSEVVTAYILKISDNRQITTALSDTYKHFGSRLFGIGSWYRLPLFFYYMIFLAVIVWFVLEHTPVGRYLFAIGGNREAARLAGIKTDAITWGTLVVSATLAGFAGLVYSWDVGTFSNDVGPPLLFPAVAAVFFGASQIKGRPNVWGALIAVYALAFGVKGLQLVFPTNNFWMEPLFQGVTLIIAVALASRTGIIKVPKRRSAKTP